MVQIIQITSRSHNIYGLDNQGTVWILSFPEIETPRDIKSHPLWIKVIDSPGVNA